MPAPPVGSCPDIVSTMGFVGGYLEKLGKRKALLIIVVAIVD
jgi:hypothetical protein